MTEINEKTVSEMFGELGEPTLLYHILIELRKLRRELESFGNFLREEPKPKEPVVEDIPWPDETPTPKEPDPVIPDAQAAPTASAAEASAHTHDDIRAIVRALTALGQSAIGKQIIKGHGFGKISGSPEDRIEDVYAELCDAKAGAANA